LDAVEQVRALHEPPHSRTRIDQDRRLAVAQKRAGGLPSVGWEPPATAEDDQRLEQERTLSRECKPLGAASHSTRRLMRSEAGGGRMRPRLNIHPRSNMRRRS